ncbi:MAG TPA: hypothetical protein VGQ57_07665 [Polyangiaceae bacterium]|nr:hypothetical protein [Polyangiaceae bacterium]
MLVLCALTGGCSLVVDSDRVQCTTDADCEARGAAFAGATCSNSVCVQDALWSCLDQPAQPPLTTGMFQAPFIVQHLVTQQPLPGVHARLCRRIDVTCASPLGDDLVTDASGQVTFSVPGGFDGYVAFDGPDIIHGLFFFNPPVAADLPQAMISIGSTEVIALLALQAGATQEPDRGVVLLGARDCTGAPAAGITFAVSGSDPAAIPFYSEQGLPSGTAQQTDSAGYGGLLNAAAGSVTFTATQAETGRRLGSVTLLAQENAITYGSIAPDGG